MILLTTTYGIAQAIFVYDGTVYTAGKDSSASSNGCYWTGTEKTIPDKLRNGRKYLFYFRAKRRKYYNYLYFRKKITPEQVFTWINTKDIFVADKSLACGIVWDNGTIYTAGFFGEMNPDTSAEANNACYWTAADDDTDRTTLAKTNLEPLYSGGSAESIFVYNGTIYTAGIDMKRLRVLLDGNDKKPFWTVPAEPRIPFRLLTESSIPPARMY